MAAAAAAAIPGRAAVAGAVDCDIDAGKVSDESSSRYDPNDRGVAPNAAAIGESACDDACVAVKVLEMRGGKSHVLVFQSSKLARIPALKTV